MKITGIDCHAVALPQDPVWGYAKGWVDAAPVLIVEVHTDAGLSGLGEAYGPPLAAREMVNALCAPVAIGCDPFRTEQLWGRLVHDARDFASSGVAFAAISALDIACWDIKGKALSVPVCTLLGGPVRTELPCYASSVRYLRDPGDPTRLADPAVLALELADQGFAALKVSVGMLDVAADLQRVQQVRAALPEDVALMVDANHAYTARLAVQVGRALEDLGVAWFEDPLPPDDIAGWEALRARLSLPLAGGETLAARAGYRELVTARLLDIIVPETGLAGGLTECKKIADLAAFHGIECSPHGYASPVGTAAAAHLAAALPYQPAAPAGLLPVEYAAPPFARGTELAREPLRVADGVLSVPMERPGLGVELDRDALQRQLLP